MNDAAAASASSDSMAPSSPRSQPPHASHYTHPSPSTLMPSKLAKKRMSTGVEKLQLSISSHPPSSPAPKWPTRQFSQGWTCIFPFPNKPMCSLFRTSLTSSENPQILVAKPPGSKVNVNDEEFLWASDEAHLWQLIMSKAQKNFAPVVIEGGLFSLRKFGLTGYELDRASRDNWVSWVWPARQALLGLKIIDSTDAWPTPNDLRGWTCIRIDEDASFVSLFRMSPSGSNNPQMIACDGVFGIRADTEEQLWDTIDERRRSGKPLLPVESGEYHRQIHGSSGLHDGSSNSWAKQVLKHSSMVPSREIWPSRENLRGWALAFVPGSNAHFCSLFRMAPSGSGHPQILSVDGSRPLWAANEYELWSVVGKHSANPYAKVQFIEGGDHHKQLYGVSGYETDATNPTGLYWVGQMKEVLENPVSPGRWPARHASMGWRCLFPSTHPHLCGLFRMSPTGSGHPQMLCVSSAPPSTPVTSQLASRLIPLWANSEEELWERIQMYQRRSSSQHPRSPTEGASSKSGDDKMDVVSDSRSPTASGLATAQPAPTGGMYPFVLEAGRQHSHIYGFTGYEPDRRAWIPEIKNILLNYTIEAWPSHSTFETEGWHSFQLPSHSTPQTPSTLPDVGSGSTQSGCHSLIRMSPSGSRNPQILSSNGKDPLWCANADQLWKSIEAFSRKCDEQGSVDGNGALLFAMKPLELTSDALASLGMSREHSYGPYSSSNDGFSRHPSQHHSYPHTPSDPHSSPGRTSSPHSHHPGHMPHQIGYGHHPISPYQAQSLSSQSAMYEPYGRLYPPANYAHWSTEIRKFFENLGDERWSGYREESPFYNSSSHATPTTPKAPTPSTPDQLTTPTKYTCPRPGCGKTFTRKGNLESHLNSHDGRKAYKCEICDIFFVRQNDKRRHDKKHVPGANGKMYECEDCHSTFSRKDALIRHRNGNCKSKRWKVESTPDRSLSQRQDSATSPLGQHRLRYSDIRLLSFNGDPAAACLGDFGDISVTYTTVRLNHAANPIVWLNPFCFVAQPAASGGEVMYIFNTLKKGYHEIGNSTNSISTRIQTSFSFHKQKEPSEGPEDGAHGNGANKTEPAPDTEMSVELRPDESAVGQFDIVEVLSDAQVRLLSTDDSATPTTTATEALEASWLNPFSFWLEHKTSSGRVEPKCFVFHPSSSAPDGQSGIYLQLTNTANSMRESLILTIQLLRNEQHIILSGRGDPRSPQDSQDEGGLSDNGHLMETNGSGEDTPMPPKKRGRAKSDLSLHSPTKGSRRAGREDSLSGSPEAESRYLKSRDYLVAAGGTLAQGEDLRPEEYEVMPVDGPHTASLYLGFGHSSFEAGDYDMALKWIYPTIEYFESNGQLLNLIGAYRDLAAIHQKKGSHSDGLKALHKAMDVLQTPEAASFATPKLEENICVHIGELLMQGNQHRQALEYFERALRLASQPVSANLFFNLGRAHEELGHENETRNWYERWVEASQPNATGGVALTTDMVSGNSSSHGSSSMDDKSSICSHVPSGGNEIGTLATAPGGGVPPGGDENARRMSHILQFAKSPKRSEWARKLTTKAQSMFLNRKSSIPPCGAAPGASLATTPSRAMTQPQRHDSLLERTENLRLNSFPLPPLQSEPQRARKEDSILGPAYQTMDSPEGM